MKAPRAKTTKPALPTLFSLCAFFCLLPLACGQNPEGPQRPEMPDKEPEITISNNAGMQMKPNPEKEGQQIIVYTGLVDFNHRPQKMTITCDRLEFFTKPPAQKPAGDEADAAEPQDQGMQAEKMIAIGNVVIVKVDAEGEQKIARSGRAVYYPDTGIAVLTISPQIQDSQTWVRAKGKEGVITIRESGVHEATDGNFETIVLQSE